MTNHITDLMINRFDTFARANDNLNADESLRDSIIITNYHIQRADFSDDCCILHCALDDELHDLTLIAFFDRDTLTIRTLILDSDGDSIFIPID